MTREIKFRAWHKNREFMSDVSAIHWDTKQVALTKSGKGAIQYLWDLDMVELLQYTGLKDKNGKEIYSGDVVLCDERVGEVQWCEDSAAWILLWQPQTKRKKGGADNLGSTFPSPQKEVIGNIYENKELLNNK